MIVPIKVTLKSGVCLERNVDMLNREDVIKTIVRQLSDEVLILSLQEGMMFLRTPEIAAVDILPARTP